MNEINPIDTTQLYRIEPAKERFRFGDSQEQIQKAREYNLRVMECRKHNLALRNSQTDMRELMQKINLKSTV